MASNAGDRLARPPRQAAAQRPARRDAAAQAPRAAGLLLRPALVGGLRDRADRARARARRAGAAAPDAVGRARRSSLLLVDRRRLLPADLLRLSRTAAAPTRSAATTSARTRRWSRPSALLIDYVLTVAVSVVAGVAAITSAVPVARAARRRAVARLRRAAHRRSTCAASRSPGRAFAIPTYGFVAARSTRCSPSASRKVAFGDGITAESAALPAAPGRRDRRPAHRLPRAARVRLGLHGADRRRGGVQRRPGVPAAEEPQRRGDARRSWASLAIDDVRRASRRSRCVAHVHMAEDPSTLIGFHRRRRRSTALSQIGLATFGDGVPFYLLQAFTAAILDPRRQHRLQRLPGAGLAARAATTTCRTSSPTAATGSSSPTGSCCWPLVASLLIVAFNAERHAPDPALHPRRVPLVHAQPGRDGAPLGAASCAARRRRRAARAAPQAGASTAPAPWSPGSCS